jgi:acyl-coenzyme A thioesterase PaaI-like protein
VLDAVAAADAPAAVAERAADLLAEAAAALAPYAAPEERAPAGNRPDLPALGHPLLPPFVIDHQGEEDVAGRVRLSRAHLGGGGAAHGGVLPLLFDDVLGHLVAHGRPSSRTAYLHVDYRRVTPLDVDLSVRGWVERVDGRKLWARGELRAGDQLLVEAEGLFLILLPGQP